MRRLVMTGATGFIGRACLGPALAAGYEVHCLARRPLREAEDHARSHWHGVDLLDRSAVDRALETIAPTHALHLAWETSHGAYWSSPRNFDWLAAGVAFIAKFAALGGQRFVAAGTCAEYEWGELTPLVEGVTPDIPHTLYGASKLAHHMALTAAQRLGVSTATGRVFFGYGPYENTARLIPYMCRQLAQGAPALCGSGRQIRDFMHVSDIGAGFIALLNSDMEGLCNISAGVGRPLSAIYEELGAISGRSDLVQTGARPDRPDDPAVLIGDNARLKTTGWKPRINLEDGLAEAYQWHKARLGQLSRPIIKTRRPATEPGRE